MVISSFLILAFYKIYDSKRYLYSFPTRRSSDLACRATATAQVPVPQDRVSPTPRSCTRIRTTPAGSPSMVVRSEEHTSELQSRGHLVCRLLLEKKKLN